MVSPTHRLATTGEHESPWMAPMPAAYDPSRRTIMLIDDSHPVRKIIEASFARIGIPVTSYPDGLSAINALAHGEVAVPDLLLLDIGLPKMDGYEVATI